MMTKYPNRFKWRNTEMSEHLNGEEIIGFSDEYHRQRLGEYIYNLLKDNPQRIALDKVYEAVKQKYVRNYDSWKYCVFYNVSTIFAEKMNEIYTERNDVGNKNERDDVKKRSDEMDALYLELQKYAKMNQFSVDMFIKWLQTNEYDQDSIVGDIILLQRSS